MALLTKPWIFHCRNVSWVMMSCHPAHVVEVVCMCGGAWVIAGADRAVCYLIRQVAGVHRLYFLFHALMRFLGWFVL